MELEIHGTCSRPGKQHPMLDLKHWQTQFPLGENLVEGVWIDAPGELARIEQARKQAEAKGNLGPSVPVDVFVWADAVLHDKPWLTRIGGQPWREKGLPWPKDQNGIPLVFLGQICFVDSKDLLPFKLPGDVALIFGTYTRGWVSIAEGSALEWSPLKIAHPTDGMDAPWTAELPFEYQGVIHRTVQYTDWKLAEGPFKAAGYEQGGWGIHSIQATSIGTYAALPQGWPFEEGDGKTLVCTLSSFYLRDAWPLCDVVSEPKHMTADGREVSCWNRRALDFGIGDAGCIWVFRDKDGTFKLDSVCG